MRFSRRQRAILTAEGIVENVKETVFPRIVRVLEAIGFGICYAIGLVLGIILLWYWYWIMDAIYPFYP